MYQPNPQLTEVEDVTKTRLSTAGAIPSVLVQGTPYDQGFTLGRAMRVLIEYNVKEMHAERQRLVSMNRDWDYDRYVQSNWEFVRAARPEVEEEILGVRDGSGVGLDDLLHFNIPAYLMATLIPQECSAFLVKNRDGGGAIMGKNRDLPNRIANILVHRVHPDGRESVEVAHAGSVLMPAGGMNDRGLMWATTGVWGKGTHVDFDALAQKWMILDLAAMTRDCDDLGQFATAIEEAKAVTNLIVQAVDASLDSAVIEYSPDQVVVTPTPDRTDVRTNHFLSEELLASAPTLEEYPSTYNRRDVGCRTLSELPPQAVPEHVWAVMSSHEGGQELCICRHDEPGAKSITTCATVTTWPQGRMEGWTGTPCTRVPSVV